MCASGIIVLYKPQGETARKTVSRVQRLARPAKAGHAGTLDPLAEGVLVGCVGKATRLIEVIHLLPKRYTATFQLGVTSDTEDIEGKLTPLEHPSVPTLATVEDVLPRFIGRIMQRPPRFSAMKINGKRAYHLARKGEMFELSPREIEVFQIEILEYRYPKLMLGIECGSGTYIRSLGRDIAGSLNTGAVMTALTRNRIGPFTLENAVTPDFLEGTEQHNWTQSLLPMETAVRHLPKIELDEKTAAKVRNGQKIPLSMELSQWNLLAAFSPSERLVSLLEPYGSGLFKAKINLAE
ncbi:MAG: tRNA pseudouridine(55) synthase TruB [Planctomycetaceae bacterium]|jgi:tRNA pseudouridine55 synthase|nr:tRNA pseudouridine(55) synthase TruB [Planctomycetaceae bacterium]